MTGPKFQIAKTKFQNNNQMNFINTIVKLGYDLRFGRKMLGLCKGSKGFL